MASIALSLLTAGSSAFAGGPRYVAGVSYFNPGVKGQALHWANGQVTYFVDRGPLSGSISNAQATAMVDAAAEIWTAVPTAAVNLIDGGNLAEDVDGATIVVGNGVVIEPSDLAPSATTTPVGVVFDLSGAVIEAIGGSGASQPDNCAQNGVMVWIDNMNPDATLAHGVIVLNGRCTTTPNLLAMMQYQLERAFGRILGLDFSQVNDDAMTELTAEPNGALGWPVMYAANGDCGPAGGTCIPNPSVLRLDDIAALNRIYPVTAANQGNFPGKLLTAANTVSIQGTVSFRGGMGMQGVNVVMRPLDGSGNPLFPYTVTFVSGAYFGGNHGNPVTGWTDSSGNRLDRFGSDDVALQGFFDLSGVPLPPGMATVNYQVSFEAVNPLYFGAISVGPYLLGSPNPSGTLQTVQVNGMQAGSSRTVNVQAANSATELISRVGAGDKTGQELESERRRGRVVRGPVSMQIVGVGGSEVEPVPLPEGGAWSSRIGQVGQSDWFLFPARGNRIFTVVAQALDETGTPSATKAMPAVGVWDGFDPTGTTAAGYGPAENGFATGETWLQVATDEDDIVRLGIADQRGDGRPDYLYRGWVLYADSVMPVRLPNAGGTIAIRGSGFRAGDTVTVGGVAAQVLSLLPTEITALVPANTTQLTGSLDVQVADQPLFNAMAVIPGGVSYDAGSNDALSIVGAPANQVPLNVPQAFTVQAQGADGSAAGGVTVSFTLTSGTATLGCGQSVCAVTATGDGRARMQVTATSTAVAVVTASLTNGAAVQAHFYGGTAAALTALSPTLYVSPGMTIAWPVQALAQSNGVPAAGQQVVWKTVAGIVAPAAAATSNPTGIAAATLTVGPLTAGQTAVSNACISGTTSCAAFTAFGARADLATLTAVSGTSQSLTAGTMPAPVTLRVLDVFGHPLAGAAVTVSQALYAWSPPCPVHGRCAQPQLLATQATTLASGLDGSVLVAPLVQVGTATNLVGLATTGSAATVSFTVEEHP